MKRQIFVLLMVFAVATGTALWAQTTGTTPPSQQVDQSGTPEQGTGVDVDVDAGANAEDGVVDVDVNRTTDSDTSAVGNDPQPNLGEGATTDTMQNDLDADNDDLPDTGSEGPLAALIGLVSLAAALALRASR
jgi:LPXTG-motif cell wall-anchored protein